MNWLKEAWNLIRNLLAFAAAALISGPCNMSDCIPDYICPDHFKIKL
jgi:hypothetical protein